MSLIPQPPYVVGRVAIQSASRGDKIIRYTMGNIMENRWIKEASIIEQLFHWRYSSFWTTKGK